MDLILEKIMEDKELPKKLKAMEPTDSSGLAALAREAGFAVSEGEAAEFLKNQKGCPLSDDELDGVAGGGKASWAKKQKS